jgi:Uma2 family endonuclease
LVEDSPCIGPRRHIVATQPVDPNQRRHWTVADYMATDDDEHRELIEGDLRATPTPDACHQRTNLDLGRELASFIRSNDLGEYFVAPFDVVLAEDTVVQPDFLFVAAERFEDLYDGHGLTGAPDLIAEVVSPGAERRDRVDRRRLYAEAGVEWLILLEPREQVVEVFHLDADGHYVLDAAAGGDETLALTPFDDLEIPLEDIWFEEPETGG